MKRLIEILCISTLLLVGGCETTGQNIVGGLQSEQQDTQIPIDKVKGRQIVGKELFDTLAGATVHSRSTKRNHITAVEVFSKSGSYQIQFSEVPFFWQKKNYTGRWKIKSALL